MRWKTPPWRAPNPIRQGNIETHINNLCRITANDTKRRNVVYDDTTVHHDDRAITDCSLPKSKTSTDQMFPILGRRLQT